MSRLNDLSQILALLLKEKIEEFRNFSLPVDKSTDAVDTAQLAVFIRSTESHFEITKELLRCITLTGITIVNDGKYSCVVTKLKLKTSGSLVKFHYIIHHESLALIGN